MNTIEILEELEALDEQYFKKFLHYYPYPTHNDDNLPIRDPSLYQMAIKAQTLLTMLGEVATKRMEYIGFDLMYSFDNPVDESIWAGKMKKEQISHEIYSTISVRITSEFKRMREYLERDSWDCYNLLSKDNYYKITNLYKQILILNYYNENNQKQFKEFRFSGDYCPVNSMWREWWFIKPSRHI